MAAALAHELLAGAQQRAHELDPENETVG
jgi:hypothetical protein